MDSYTNSIVFKLLRVIIPAHLLTVVLQATWAGSFMSGNMIAVTLHELTARILIGLCLLQIVAAAYLRVRQVCPRWILVSAIGILLAEVIETYSGYRHILVLHVPLAIGIFGGIMRQFFWAMREARPAELSV
jgi:hypothetical protein